MISCELTLHGPNTKKKKNKCLVTKVIANQIKNLNEEKLVLAVMLNRGLKN